MTLTCPCDIHGAHRNHGKIIVKDYELNPKSEVNPESWTQPKGSLQNQSPCFMDIIILSLCQLYQVSHFYFLIHFST